MKIAIIGIRGIPARYGGFETCAQELAVGLAKRGHQVSVYCRYSNIPSNPRQYKGVSLVYLPHIDSKNLGTLSHSFLAFTHSIFKKYDVILAFNVGIAPLCLIPKLFMQKIILNVDGLEWKRKKWGYWAKKYFQTCERLAPIFSDKIISDSRVIQKYYSVKYQTSSTYIPYGAYTKKKLDLEILKKYDLSKGDYFFIASRLEPENNADLAIQAFTKLDTNKKLIIAGGANYSSRYIQDLTKIKDKRIMFTGPIYEDGHIEALHLGCFAYIHGNEVGGTNPALLKAMGYGNLILALDVPFNKEVVGDCAIIYKKSIDDLRNKLQYVLDHTEIRQKYQKKAMERIRKYYYWDKVIDSYEQLFYSIQK